MSIKDYRRQIEQEIEQARALSREPVLDVFAEGEGALASIRAAGGLRMAEDVDRAREILRDDAADPGLRAAALEGVFATHPDPETAHETALERLADPDESPVVRRLALQLLKQAAFHSPSVEEWRPQFLDALRDMTRDENPDLRIAAFEVLAAEKDSYAQEVLLDGLRNPSRALVPVEDALSLLGYDIHADVQEIAAEVADDPPSERARIEALHLLASDSGSADRFAGLFADADEEPKVRRLAATALSSLSPDTFRSVARNVLARDRARGGVFSIADSRASEELRRHVQALLELDE